MKRKAEMSSNGKPVEMSTKRNGLTRDEKNDKDEGKADQNGLQLSKRQMRNVYSIESFSHFLIFKIWNYYTELTVVETGS